MPAKKAGNPAIIPHIRNHPANTRHKSKSRRLTADLPWTRIFRKPSALGDPELSIRPQSLYALTGSCCRTSEFSGLGFIFSFCLFYEPLYDGIIRFPFGFLKSCQFFLGAFFHNYSLVHLQTPTERYSKTIFKIFCAPTDR